MHKVAVIAGDGIGPEVTAAAVALLELRRRSRALPLEIVPLDLGAERYLRDGTTFPASIREFIERECSAVFLGALGDARVPDFRHAAEILFGMRFGFDLYANVRPVVALADRLVPLKDRGREHVNFVVFRENTEGIYAGIGGQLRRGTVDEIAINEDVNTRRGVERIVRAAFDYAAARGKRCVHMADKSNAMRHAHELWLRVFDEVRADYPTIRGEHVYVDALCLRLVQEPEAFEVIVTNNLFGDIVSDLGAALAGGLGMAPSANLNPTDAERTPLFEPVHGSAPALRGTGRANPFAALLTAGWLLEHLGFDGERELVERAVAAAVERGDCTPDVGGHRSTAEAADAVLELVDQVGPRSVSGAEPR